MRIEGEPFCGSPVGDASPSSPPPGSAQVVEVVKAARNEHRRLGLDKLSGLCYPGVD